LPTGATPRDEHSINSRKLMERYPCCTSQSICARKSSGNTTHGAQSGREGPQLPTWWYIKMGTSTVAVPSVATRGGESEQLHSHLLYSVSLRPSNASCYGLPTPRLPSSLPSACSSAHRNPSPYRAR
jgi:hypothetical protein